jgi:tetratricopeptide (TPR) repeat protein
MLALTNLNDLWFQSSESPLISFAQASKNIKRALALDHEDYFAHIALSQLYSLRKEPDKAIPALERAIAINPSGALAYYFLSSLFQLTGKPEEGLKLIEKAIRLNPIPPAQYLNVLAGAYHSLGRYQDAIKVRKKVLKRSPNNLFAHIGLTADYSASGRIEEARHQAEELLRLDPSFSVERFAETLPIKDKAEVERHIGNLRKAGLK